MAKGKEQRKVKKVLKEFSSGELHSGSKSGPLVKDKAQALAIGYSEGRKKRKVAMHKKEHHEEHEKHHKGAKHKLIHKDEVKGGHDSHEHHKGKSKHPVAIKAKVASHKHHKAK